MVPQVKCPPVCIVPGLEMVAPVELVSPGRAEHQPRHDRAVRVILCAVILVAAVVALVGVGGAGSVHKPVGLLSWSTAPDDG
jgi:hypothetical protein